MRQKLIASRPFSYATRALKEGDQFDATRVEARVLVATGRAKIYVPDPLDPLRAEQEAMGVKADHRWGEKRLRDEIKAAKAPKADDE